MTEGRKRRHREVRRGTNLCATVPTVLSSAVLREGALSISLCTVMSQTVNPKGHLSSRTKICSFKLDGREETLLS